MIKIKNIKYLFFLPLLSLIVSACQSSSPATKPTTSTYPSTITLDNSSKPRIELANKNNTAIITMDATSSKIITQNDQTTFKDIASNTDAIYKKIENGIKEEIILHQPPTSPPIYKFIIDADNLKPQFFQGQYYFFDDQGYSHFTIPRPFMVDSRGQRSEAVSISITNNIITLTPDHNWLIDQKRQYPVTVDPSLVVPNSPIRELADKRTISAKTYDLGSGKFAATSTLKALHYQDSAGKWQDIDTAIVPSSDPEYNFMNQTNSYQTYFSTDGFGQKKAVKFQVKDAWMKFKIMSASGTGQKNNVEENKFNFDQIIKNGEDTMAANYTLEPDRLLEEVVLNQFQGYPQIKQEIELHNAILKPDGKKINAFHPTTNELLWIIPEPVMYEVNSPERKNYGLHYEIACTNSDCSTLILSKVIDPEGQAWLSDPNRIYPLVIDTTAGPNDPALIVNNNATGTVSWGTPSNAVTSNNIYTTAVLNNQISYYLEATGFVFSIPSGSNIDGIVCGVEKKATDIGAGYPVQDSLVRIVKPSEGITGLSYSYDGVWPGTDTYYEYGDSNSLWGETWTYSDINDTSFGIAFSAKSAIYLILGSTSTNNSLSHLLKNNFLLRNYHNSDTYIESTNDSSLANLTKKYFQPSLLSNSCSSSYCSLSSESLVSTPTGYIKIKDIKINDQVYSFNEKTKKIEIKKVLAVHNTPIKKDNNRYFYIYYDDKIIKATENHMFYINDSYLRADQLRVGDPLLGTDLKKHYISKINIVKNTTDIVWNLTIEDNHNFFVEDILTHNASYTASVDHIRMTVYYSDATPPPAIQIEGIKMEGIKIN